MATTEAAIVALSYSHSIAGRLVLQEQRLSDMLNDRRESVVRLRDAVLTRLSTGKLIERNKLSIASKEHLVLVFEQGEHTAGSGKRPYAYTIKQAYHVFIVAHSFEVRGIMYSKGNLDIYELHRFIATSSDIFVPVVEATVILPNGQEFRKQTGVMVNAPHIDYITKLDLPSDASLKAVTPSAAQRPAS